MKKMLVMAAALAAFSAPAIAQADISASAKAQAFNGETFKMDGVSFSGCKAAEEFSLLPDGSFKPEFEHCRAALPKEERVKVATDLPVRSQPRVDYEPEEPLPPRVEAPQVVPRVRQDSCAWVLVQVQGGPNGGFRVVVDGRTLPPIFLQGDRICIPRAVFARAQVVEVCLGQGPEAKRIIRGQWMTMARANLERGDLVNPGQPMFWRNTRVSNLQMSRAKGFQSPAVMGISRPLVMVRQYPPRRRMGPPRFMRPPVQPVIVIRR